MTGSVRSIWLAGIAVLLLGAGILWYLAPLKPGVLVLQFAFTPRAFGAVIHFWSADQLARFRTHLLADYALLGSYGLFGYLLAARTRLFAVLGSAGRCWAKWALPVAACVDAAENTLQLWLTAAPRFGVELPYLLAAGCASIKWLVLLAYALTVVCALGLDPGGKGAARS